MLTIGIEEKLPCRYYSNKNKLIEPRRIRMSKQKQERNQYQLEPCRYVVNPLWNRETIVVKKSKQNFFDRLFKKN